MHKCNRVFIANYDIVHKNVIKKRHMKSILCQIALSMWMLCGIGVVVKGKRASRDQARILVAAPHSTFFDAIVIFVTKMSSPIVREEDKSLGSKFRS